MSKTWPLFILVILKYFAEKRPLKTHVEFFFMKVTVYVFYSLLRVLKIFGLMFRNQRSNTLVGLSKLPLLSI
jgi:hypothetical protein